MAADMADQPRVLASCIERWDVSAELIRAAVPRPLRGIVLVARGSSDNAALYGRYLLELATGLPVSMAAPSLITLYRGRLQCRDHLVVAASQSGRTPEIQQVVEELRAEGAHALALTNDGNSPLAASADMVVELGAGEERAIPATKTVIAELVSFALLGGALGVVPWSRDDLAGIPAAAESVLGDRDPARRLAERLSGERELAVVARGFLYCAAKEAALKLKEAARLVAEAYSAADFRHGPIALVGELPVLALHVRGAARPDVMALIRGLRRREVRIFEASDRPGADLPLPRVAEALAPILAVLRSQQLALELALARELDPDLPPWLRKVTRTR